MRPCCCFLTLFVLTQAGVLQAQEGKIRSAFDVSVTASLYQPRQANFHVAKFDLGRLPLKETGVVTLTVENPTAKPFPFTKITKSSCFNSLTPESDVISAGDSIEFKAQFRTPEFAMRELQSASFRLIDENVDKKTNLPLNIYVTYKIASLVYIVPQTVALEVPETSDFVELRIPFLFTKPISAEQLEIKVEDELKDLAFEFENDGNDFFAIAFVPAEVVVDGPVSGKVTILDRDSKREDSVFVTLRQGTAYKISPAIQMFAPVSEHSVEKEGRNLFVASALIRRPESEKANPERKEAAVQSTVSDFQVDASIAGVACRVETQTLSTRIVKARVYLDATKLVKASEQQSQIINWTIRDGGKPAASITTRFTLPVSLK